MNMLAPIDWPSSAVASADALTKWVLRGPGERGDRALEPLRRQREFRIARELAGQHLGEIDDHRGGARLDRGEHLLVAGDDDVAAEHEFGGARRDADGVDVLRPVGEADVARHRPALLGEPRHVDDADALAFEMGGHARGWRRW